jgi:hypothetical protein
VNQLLCKIAKSLSDRFDEQVVFTSEVLIKASMGQACVTHDSRNRSSVQSLSAYATGCILHNPLTNFRFVIR